MIFIVGYFFLALLALCAAYLLGGRHGFDRGRKYEAWLRDRRAEEILLSGVDDVRRAGAVRELADG